MDVKLRGDKKNQKKAVTFWVDADLHARIQRVSSQVFKHGDHYRRAILEETELLEAVIRQKAEKPA